MTSIKMMCGIRTKKMCIRDSDSGVQLESTNPGEPGDTGGPDDPTPVIIPSVDIAKQVTGLTLSLIHI